MPDSLTAVLAGWAEVPPPAVPSTRELDALARRDPAVAFVLYHEWNCWYHDFRSDVIEARVREILERDGYWDEDREDWCEDSREDAEAEAWDWFDELRPDLDAEYWRLHQWAWRQGHTARDAARVRRASRGLRCEVESTVRMGLRARRYDRRARRGGLSFSRQSSPVVRIARPRERRERRASSSSSSSSRGDGSGLADSDPEPPLALAGVAW